MKYELQEELLRALRRALKISRNLMAVSAVLFLCAAAGAQLAGKGGISGTVADPTGAAIPGATIVVTNTATGVSAKTTSTSAGDYSLSALDPGKYTATVTANGFETLTQRNIQVNALETQTFNPKLSIGSSAETVTVTAAPPQLETTNAQLGATLENDMYSALPIEMGAYGQPDQRRATDFAALMPGVQSNETNGNATDNVGPINGSGSRGAASAIYIDGLPFTNAAGEGDPRFVWTAISVDAVDQFQVETSGYSALYEGQGVENFNVKQGGDKYHGGVYEFFRNTALDSWGFYKATNAVTGKLQKPVEHQNEYGILLSGPLVPFGSWRHKLFFFGNYNGFRYLSSTPQLLTFPNLAEQAGNFQGVIVAATPANLANPNIGVFDPNTQSECTSNSTTGQCRYRLGYVYGGTPGPGGDPVLGPGGTAAVDVIPAGEISSIAQAMQANIPALSNQNLTNNFVSPNPTGLSNWSTTDRIDWDISSKDILSFTAAIGRQASSVPAGQTSSGRNTGPVPYNYGQAYAPKTAVGIIEETHTFTSHIINQLKYGFARYNSTAVNADQGSAYAASGAYHIAGLPAGQAADSFPITTFAGTNAPTNWAGYTANAAIANAYTLVDNVEWIKGRHNLTLGIDIDWLQYNDNPDLGETSPLTLANAVTETAGYLSGGTTLIPSTGDSYASFLFGQISQASLTQNVIPATTGLYRPISPYVQDTWKVSNHLTLDLGLRWDYYPPYREKHNVLSFFDPNLTNPITNSPGALQFAGHGAGTCNCSTNVHTYYKNFGPRIGFAYQTDPRTVVRGSFDVVYTHGNGVGGSAVSRQGTGTLGFSAKPSFSANGSSLSTATLDSGFPAFTPAAGVASGNGYGTGYTKTSGYTGTPQSASYGDPEYGGRAPQYIDYTLGFQHQWTQNFTTSISYVGSEGHFLIADASNAQGYWSDQLDPKYLSLGSCLGAKVSALGSTVDTQTGNPCSTELAASGATVPSWFSTSQTLSNALLPFPQYKVGVSYDNTSNSFYSALQVTAQKRMAHGTTFMINYTWSRTIDDGGTFRSGYAIPAAYSNTGKAWTQDAIERAVSTSNQPHHFVFTGVENLPIGSGRLGGGHAWTRAVLGGFKFSQILQLASGSPLALTASSCSTNPAQSTCEPTLNPGFIGSARNGSRWRGIDDSGNVYQNIIASTGDCMNTAPAGPFINPGASNCLNNPAYAPAYTFGNAPRTAPYGLTGPGIFDLDISLRRTFALHITDSTALSLQADLYNVTNYVQFSGIGTTLGSSSFGEPSSQGNNTRSGQLSARIEF
ncbi:MAG TPA: carboxypeptidase regulatory-like domain-containing protein [Acidobacteriaceae bacterium]|nr:carboxypeptidase regulatory-like domain-containing protein [Acidobacteriaceae bacterium]